MSIIHLEAHGVAVVLEHGDGRLPRVVHWGPALGETTPGGLDALSAALSRQSAPGTLDAAWQVSLSPQEGDGFTGRPGLQLRRRGVLHHPRWVVEGEPTVAAASVSVTAADAASGLRLVATLAIDTGGVVWARQRLELAADADEPVEIEWLEPTMPVPSTVDTLLTFGGRWTREKRPVSLAFPPGSSVRQSRRGRPGHDSPVAIIASRGPARWGEGEVWGAHAAWSSDATYRTDRVTDAITLLGAGEMLRPGELVLQPGESTSSPGIAFVYSDGGLDGFAWRVHEWMRARPQHPRTPRPLVLNTWEAVYFDHDPARLIALAERAAGVGIERFVLDDGWFAGRRNDSTSLGDWVVDRTVWPEGLEPLADRVHELGMQFGLWFEPEMVSLDSDLARAHPEWLLHDPGHLDHPDELSWRQQYVLDLANPGAFAHVLGQISALVDALGIDFIKWDHNRDLVDSVHDGRPGGHAQMLAVYELIRELKRRHPGLEIESCSSGGARTDLGILDVTDRVWASDSNDPIERQDIQRWTGLLLPPELVGAHVGPTDSHSSGRRTSLALRMATSLMGSAGFEWDIASCDDDELAAIARFAALYTELRPVLHTGVVRHPELRDPAWRATAHVTADEAVVIVATVASLEDARAERLRIPGLAPDRTYRVRVRREIGEAAYGWIAPEWFTAGEITLPGAVLERVGLQLPTLWPAQAFVLHLQAQP
ncbi:alpha-galactosidase [Microbacterium fluvii]|uniref:alpha-galactosidase n=1 Tax=Microbacterium fluvii TaxID=415215 RepID=A0ABW2HE05_9MICO|nr:alpha-galactosidase [Microbacterium fluvii]MCU4671320.1 alpha-galactosidase [Microbacterium fluvii]